MRRALTAVALAVLLGAALFFFWPHPLRSAQASPELPTGDALVERGRYLTIGADCAACHTLPGRRPFSGGLAFKLPFGTIYAPNITSDPNSGIGAWSDAAFVRAMREGVGRHGEDLYPAFPYTSYAGLSTDDVLAIRTYLRTVPPSATPSKANALIFPFNQRPVMRAWKLLFLPGHPLAPRPDKSGAWNRGAYLVETLAHCGECHTPRNLMFAMDRSRALAGGEVDGWKAWNLTPDPQTGLGRWSGKDIGLYLATGHAPDHGSAAAGMRQAIDLSLSKLSAADIDAIVTYLQALPPRRGDLDRAVRPPPAELLSSGFWTPAGARSTGATLFAGACAGCHGWNGRGQQGDRAGLIGDHAVYDRSGANVVRVILQGSSAPTDVPSEAMPAFAKAYSDVEVALLANYVIDHFGGRHGRVTPAAVRKARQ
jgi:mono/diheme cytochrome c family protein